MLYFEGDKDFAPSPDVVWSKLSDARFLAQCIPGVESVTVAEPQRLVCTLRPGFAFVRGTLDLTVEIVQASPQQEVQVLLQTRGIGSTSEVAAKLTLTPKECGTRIHWRAEIKSLGGLLKAIPQGLIKAAAQKVIADALTTVYAKLSQP